MLFNIFRRKKKDERNEILITIYDWNSFKYTILEQTIKEYPINFYLLKVLHLNDKTHQIHTKFIKFFKFK